MFFYIYCDYPEGANAQALDIMVSGWINAATNANGPRKKGQVPPGATGSKAAAGSPTPEDNNSEKCKTDWKEDSFHVKKPDYENPGMHDPSSPNFNSRKTPLPSDAEAVYKKAIPSNATLKTWFGINSEGDIYRYSSNNLGQVHFSGSSSSTQGLDVPSKVQESFRSTL